MTPPSGMRILAHIAVAGLSTVVLPVAAPAQESDEPQESAGAPAIADVAAAIDPGSYVRVTWDRGRRDVGKLQPPGPIDALSLRASAGTIEIPYAAIDSMWTGRTRTADGAAIGGLAGAVAGGLVLLGLNEALCESPSGACGGPSTSGWVIMIGGGAAVGTGVGALIGSGTLGWDVVFPPDDPVTPATAPPEAPPDRRSGP